jgi:hypothetical protein
LICKSVARQPGHHYFRRHMHEGYRVVSTTPAGRRRYIEILYPYLLSQRHLIDKHVFWVNTLIPENIEFLEQLAAQYPDFFELHYLESLPEVPAGYDCSSAEIYRFFPRYVDPDTIYLRFDDDICYIAPDTVRLLLDYRLRNREALVILPTIINNSFCSHLYQRFGALSRRLGVCNYEILGIAWERGEFAQMVHEEFLDALRRGEEARFKFNQWLLHGYERMSINSLCWMGSDFARFGGKVGSDEENWLTHTQPEALKKPNVILGQALVAHFAFHPQRAYLENETNLLSVYQELSQQRNAEALAARHK